jgi:hypothetical protein
VLRLLPSLYAEICAGGSLNPEALHVQLQEANLDEAPATLGATDGTEAMTAEVPLLIQARRVSVKPRGKIKRRMCAGFS